jgi:hypothetical protein
MTDVIAAHGAATLGVQLMAPRLFPHGLGFDTKTRESGQIAVTRFSA